MKIIQFLNNTGQNIGGVEQCCINYAKSLSLDKGNSVNTILPNKDTCYRDQIIGKIFEVNIKNKIKLFVSLVSIIYKIKPDFLILHCSRGLKLFKILSIIYKFKIIGVNHGFNLVKFTKFTDIIFCINKSQMTQVKNIIRGQKTEVVYFPNVTEVKDKIIKKDIGKKIRIGTLSRIDFKYKNLDKIVLAAKIMQDKNMDFIFHIGGDFGEISQLKLMVKNANLNDYFIFKGFIKDKEEFFDEIDIFCMPSKEETFGIAYIEAMSNKVPCIATNNTGALEIFAQKDSAILIDKNDEDSIPNKIYEAIKFIADNRNYRIRMIENSFKIVSREFSLKSSLLRFNQIVQK
ncbi:MAG: glycosyltransferase [Rickettsiales bacterium]